MSENNTQKHLPPWCKEIRKVSNEGAAIEAYELVLNDLGKKMCSIDTPRQYRRAWRWKGLFPRRVLQQKCFFTLKWEDVP